MIYLESKDKRIILKLDGDKRVNFLTHFTFNMLFAYQEVSDIYETPKEKFRDFIFKADLITDFKKSDYLLLTDRDLTKIAMSFDEVEEKCITSDEDVFKEIFSKIDEKEKQVKESLLGIFNSFDLSSTINKIEGTVRAIEEMGKKLAENIAPVVSQIQVVGKQWAETIGKFVLEHEMYLDAKEKAALIATKYDWFIAYDLYTSKRFYESLVGMDSQEASTEIIDNLFIEYYDEELRNKMLEDLRAIDFLKQYDEMLNQVETGYNNELYYLVVPSLFVLIEGMIARGFNHIGQMRGAHMSSYLEELLKNESGNSLHEIINKRMLVSFKHGYEIDSPISRHAIIHGGDINYGREAVALRLFLILYNVALALGFRKVGTD